MSIFTTRVGMNRTGIETARKRANAMLRATEEFPTVAEPDGSPIVEVREQYASEADPMGTMPPPPSVSGTIKAAADMLVGKQPVQLLDKLGERLAFERTGVRLYEAILGKLECQGGFPGGPTAEEVEQILLQEYAHFRLMEDVLKRLGADPTVLTPSANVHATMASGIVQVVVDPRTSLVQALEAALLAELSDREGWDTLHQLLIDAGQLDAVEHVTKAIQDEAEHLARVRAWLAAAQGRQFEDSPLAEDHEGFWVPWRKKTLRSPLHGVVVEMVQFVHR